MEQENVQFLRSKTRSLSCRLHSEPDMKATIESSVLFESISFDIAVVLT